MCKETFRTSPSNLWKSKNAPNCTCVISCPHRWSIELGRLVDICTGQACSSCIERTSIGLDISGKGWRRSLSPNRDHAEKAVRSRWRLRLNVRPTSALQEPNNVGEEKHEYAGSPWQLGHGIWQHLVSFGKSKPIDTASGCPWKTWIFTVTQSGNIFGCHQTHFWASGAAVQVETREFGWERQNKASRSLSSWN